MDALKNDSNKVRNKIVLVDDNLANLEQGRNILKTFYEVYPAQSAAKLFEILEKITPNLILLDIEMPVMNGFEAIVALKADERWKDIPVIFITAKTDSASEVEGFDLGAADYVIKPFSPPILLKRIEKELLIVKRENEFLNVQSELKEHLSSLERLINENSNAMARLQGAVLSTVVDMVDFRDKYTGGHIVRTQQYLKALIEGALETGVYADEISHWDKDSVFIAAKLHDVGKIAVSDMILSKDAKLSEEEFENMKAHVLAGVDAIEGIMNKVGENNFYNHAIRMAGTHHEKWNGTGYPIGLKGYNIPLEGRLMAIADVYDALISKRQYKEAISHEKVCEIIEQGASSQFDPELVKVFSHVKHRFAEIATGFVAVNE